MPTHTDGILINERGFAFDPETGETYQLSVTALHLVKLMRQGCDEECMLRELLDRFDVDEHTARRDLAAFIRNVENIGWKS